MSRPWIWRQIDTGRYDEELATGMGDEEHQAYVAACEETARRRKEDPERRRQLEEVTRNCNVGPPGSPRSKRDRDISGEVPWPLLTGRPR